MNLHFLSDTFRKIYPQKEGHDPIAFFSPGRINLIGEHTDYNGGHVFPAAITYGTYGLARKRSDRLVRMFSMNFEEKGIIEFTLDDLNYKTQHHWVNYSKGMIRFIQELGKELPCGLDVLIYGNIPNGAGLSSSASLEMLTGVMVNELYGFQLEMLDIVKAGKRVENEFIGVKSGIMDQFAIGMGKDNCGILLNCNTLKYEYAPLPLSEYKIIIMNTNKRRVLSDSKYNTRRSECEKALKLIQQECKVQSLGEITEEEFETYKYLINNDVLQKRARHAVYENQRTLNALQALKNDDLKDFGRLMNDSHVSLRDDYEVTGSELDSLVEAAWKQEGVVGARMTGAGFGGCAIAIVKEEMVEKFIFEVGKEYQEKIGYQATFYVASIGNGTKAIE
ncbi:galactokinase [Heyndrickxia oleronia]|uniref:Galactokinase n=1 Tax=Heyndrickxia oleronia TaxID=38875 RepID=A0AAW6SRH4_9BACI|nr:galactokinase [Heyndrickxia oleronia]MDH5159466.1 galactokinase [Heyndrickxia oleronia]